MTPGIMNTLEHICAPIQREYYMHVCIPACIIIYQALDHSIAIAPHHNNIILLIMCYKRLHYHCLISTLQYPCFSNFCDIEHSLRYYHLGFKEKSQFLRCFKLINHACRQLLFQSIVLYYIYIPLLQRMKVEHKCTNLAINDGFFSIQLM